MADPVRELEQLQKELAEIQAAIPGFVDNDVPREYGEAYKREFQKAIDDRRSPSGRKHAALAPATVKRKKKVAPGFSQHPLVRTSGLRGNPDYDLKKGEVTIGFDYRDKRGRRVPLYHQTGTADMPARPIVGPSKQAQKVIAKRLRTVAAKLTRTVFGQKVLLEAADVVGTIEVENA